QRGHQRGLLGGGEQQLPVIAEGLVPLLDALLFRGRAFALLVPVQ
ncbi:MAG: hypothetical protein H7Z21_02045, partial [Hymenobacter sp.]|nr:hypothetical protein [Hymenobacter sp.]